MRTPPMRPTMRRWLRTRRFMVVGWILLRWPLPRLIPLHVKTEGPQKIEGLCRCLFLHSILCSYTITCESSRFQFF